VGPRRATLLLAALVIGRAGSVSAQDAFDIFGAQCLETELHDCRVLSAGVINSDEGAAEPLLAWQTQAGFTPEAGVLGGFVLFTHESGAWRPFDAGFDGYRFSPPQLNEMGLLHIAGYTGGTGAYNADRLYQWGDLGHAVYREGWRRIDMEAWLDTLGAFLPAGLEVWKGVQYSIDRWSDGVVARTPLWRPDDANCCATGGSALITFTIADDRLVIARVTYIPPEKPGD